MSTDNQNFLEVPQKPDLPTRFRDDLRPPSMQWGRCCVTGEWGPVIGIDLGDISIEAPVVDKGVIFNEVTKEVTFTCWRPARFEQQANFSLKGLEMLMAYYQNSSMPVPMITPHLVYMWQVMYVNGEALAQFEFDAIKNIDIERHSGEIDFEKVSQLSIVSREGPSTFTFVKATGKFFKDGQELDLDYDGEYPDNAEIYYARKVTHTWGSVMGNKLAREIQDAATTVLQLVGWKTPGDNPTNSDSTEKCCVISIDDRGNWRPWKYIE